MKIEGVVPKQDDYKLLPEWSKHEESYMLWPTRPDNWREGGKPAQKTYAEIAKKLVSLNQLPCWLTKSSIYIPQVSLQILALEY
ncbi:agmatine deiminase [Lentilactobacillus kosonis]|uniref:Agmatine deiminase n=1 Tax=Lentilactobacillus kosonis TaxID=2810561 RepID=A0A401FJ09_9LACO|nr:agmatine deiminase [Lentilactobacillus kosonis]